MESFKRLNLLIGWLLFAISGLLYWVTMPPTTSLWDCGEFIACMAGMEVGHPPGAPVYLLIGRFFNLFAGDPANIAYTANLVSVFASAGTVMLLHFSASHLLQRLFPTWMETTAGRFMVISAATIGAMAFAVTDTFWFSAVEAEVYALSVFFTALCFWLFLKWEEAFVSGRSSFRWLILIAYLMGLSVGVHLLNLLIIPVLVLIILLRNRPLSLTLFGKALLVGGGILGFILFGVIQNGLYPASRLELLMVNGFGWPQHSGLICFVVIVFGGLFALVFISRIKRPVLHMISVLTLVFMIGYSSYAMIILRAEANTPINLNHPSDVFTLDAFLNREQYAQNPLLYGQYYNAEPGKLKYTTGYRFNGNVYQDFQKADQYEYNAEGSGWFPRMHSSRPVHVYGYQQWAGVDGKSKERPSFLKNLQFLMTYQINHMYVRYFMWNFVGRQNDEQGHGELINGNWVSGIPFIDRDNAAGLLHSSSAGSKARNVYFFLPLLLGLVGILFLLRQKSEGSKVLTIISLLFVMTGPVIIFYLNQTPFEPRERDYAYVGSFYAFAMFLSFGAFGIMKWMVSKVQAKGIAVMTYLLLVFAVPGWMLAQNFDDHNRSQRSLALDSAKSYLDACEPNAILFTYGDNDTYPLWYVQEVEKYRTDVRVINFGLMGADWCIRQLSKAGRDGQAIKMSIPLSRYTNGDLDHALLVSQNDDAAPLMSVVSFIGNDAKDSKLPLQSGTLIDYAPYNRFELASASGDTLRWKCPKRVLYKNDIALLDILATNAWERPIYFTAGADPDIFMGLEDHLRYDGLVYRLMTSPKKADESIYMDHEALMDIYLNKIKLGDGTKAYYDHHCRRHFEVFKYRQIANLLAVGCLAEGKQAEAQQVLLKSLHELPIEVSPAAPGNIPLMKLLWASGLTDEANRATQFLLTMHINNLYWFSALPAHLRNAAYTEFEEELKAAAQWQSLLQEENQLQQLEELQKVYSTLGIL